MPILIQEQPFPFVGLGTFTFTIPAAGVYNVKCQSYLPNAVAMGGGAGSGPSSAPGVAPLSSLVVTVTQNASTIFTSPVVTPTQGAMEFKTPAIVCAASDAITVVLSSSSATDALLNSLKSIITIGVGE